jgi:hypothetical protein
MKKLSRAEIKAGLEQVPMETLLLGASASKTTKLTHKQKEFARQIALGETKAGAYRKAYKSKAKPQTASIEGQRLMKNPAVSLQAEAISLALEVQKYTTPAHLRALAIHKITEKVLDKDCPPAQQLKALELLGKITEVSLFTERREIIQTQSSGDMKEKLMESLRLAIANSQAIDVEAHQADDLLAELVATNSVVDDVSYSELADNDVKEQSMASDTAQDDHQDGDTGNSIENPSTPLTPDPQFSALPQSANLHSIPDSRSPVKSTLTPVKDKISAESTSYESSNANPNIGTPPVNVSNAKG